MFKKLLANLPYNPGLIHQVNFYSKRLRQEAGVRRLGFILIAMALVVQTLAALYPAQKSLAASPNHILDGISNKQSILRAWDANTGNVREIYGKFGITRQNIANIPGQSPNSTVVSTSSDWWSIGRLPLSDFGISSTHWGERTVKISGSLNVYQRPLHAWDTGPSSSYKAFHGVNQFGVGFWILQDCGNATFHGPYLPKPPKPKLTVHKTLLTPNKVKPGDTVKFRLEFRNTVEDSLATNFKLTDRVAANFDYVSLEGISSNNGGILTIQKDSLGFTTINRSRILTVKVKPRLKSGTVICNQATVSSKETGSSDSEQPCVVVINPPCSGAACTPPPVTASGYCVSSSAFLPKSNNDFSVKTETFVSGGAMVQAYNYGIDNNSKLDTSDKTGQTTHTKTFNNFKPGNHTINVTAQLKSPTGKLFNTVNCPVSLNVSEEPRLVQSKSVANVTENLSNASGTKVKNNDVLKFTLNTQNVTSSDFKNYKGEDFFGNVLQYADIVDPSSLEKQGITLTSDKFLRWNTAVIKGNSSDIKVITVKVKAVIPSTNRPSNVSADYNCTISNLYGNEVKMSVSCPLVKNIETASNELPNTGPGLGVMCGFIVALAAGYFFARSRLIAKELDIIKADQAGSDS